MRPLQTFGLAALLVAVSTQVLAQPSQTADPKQHLSDVFDRAKEGVGVNEMDEALGLVGRRRGEWSKVAPYGEQRGKEGTQDRQGDGQFQAPDTGSSPLQPGSPSETGNSPDAPGGPTPVASPVTSDGPLQPGPDLILAQDKPSSVKVPVPASAWLLGVGLFGLAALGMRRCVFPQRRPV